MFKRIISAWMAILVVLGMTSSFTPTASAAIPLDHWVNRIPSYSNDGFKITDICYADGRFAAAASNGVIFTSSDGVTWNNSGTVATSLSGISCDGGKITAVGTNVDGVFLAYQSDGAKWNRSSELKLSLEDIAYGQSTYVAVGFDDNLNRPVIVTSKDVVNGPYQYLSPGDQLLHGVVYGDKFVAVGDAGTIITSVDGVNWTSQTFRSDDFPSDDLHNVTYGNGTYVAVGVNGVVLTSSDGNKWMMVGRLDVQDLTGAAYGDGTIVAVGSDIGGGMITYRSDSGTWSYHIIDYRADIQAIAYGNNTFVLGGESSQLWQNYLPNFRVSYDGNGETSGTAPADDNGDMKEGIFRPKGNTGSLANTGYLFEGWNTSRDGDGTDYVPNSAYIMRDADLKLYAKWVPDPAYTVIYNGNGNDGGTSPLDTYLYFPDDFVIVFDNHGRLTKTGLAFIGWNTEADGSGTFYFPGDIFDKGPTQVTLYAQYAEPHFVHYDGNGNTGGSAPPSLEYGTFGWVFVEGDNGLSIEGFDFTGWNTAADGSGTSYSPGKWFHMGVEDITLYAQWKRSGKTVTYRGNGETGGEVPVDPEYYDGFDYFTILGPGSMVKEGYVFDYWNGPLYPRIGDIGYPGDRWSITSHEVSEMILTAHWTKAWTLTYDGNGNTGGKVPYEPELKRSGKLFPVLGNPGELTKTGYTFAGWNTAADGSGDSYSKDDGLTLVDKDVTLYAQWKLNPTPPRDDDPPVPPRDDTPTSPRNDTPTPTPTPEPTPTPTPTPTPAPVLPTVPTDTHPVLNTSLIPSPVNLQHTLSQLLASAPVVTFPDVKSTDWSAHGVSLAAQLGIVKGAPDGNFHGSANVTRAEFSAMVVRALHLDTSHASGNDTFSDTKGHWAEALINALKQAGVLSGTGDGSFKPDQPISRAEIAAILARLMNMTSAATNSFSDTSNSWAKSYIEEMHNAGIIYGTGNNQFKPTDHASRAEAVIMILRMLNVTLELGLDL